MTTNDDGTVARWLHLASIALRKQDDLTDYNLRKRRNALQKQRSQIALRTKELRKKGAPGSL